MYLGKIDEIADKYELQDKPQHPYTELFLSAILIPDPTVKRKRIILEGDVPFLLSPPKGCRFNTKRQYTERLHRAEEAPIYRYLRWRLRCLPPQEEPQRKQGGQIYVPLDLRPFGIITVRLSDLMKE